MGPFYLKTMLRISPARNRGSTSMQQCYSEKGRCKGVEACFIEVTGKKGEKVTWKSSCGGYAHTKIDGKSEYAKFKCK
jgi:hypothetical protein